VDTHTHLPVITAPACKNAEPPHMQPVHGARWRGITVRHALQDARRSVHPSWVRLRCHARNGGRSFALGDGVWCVPATGHIRGRQQQGQTRNPAAPTLGMRAPVGSDQHRPTGAEGAEVGTSWVRAVSPRPRSSERPHTAQHRRLPRDVTDWRGGLGR